jgi:hypothetical protein
MAWGKNRDGGQKTEQEQKAKINAERKIDMEPR